MYMKKIKECEEKGKICNPETGYCKNPKKPKNLKKLKRMLCTSEKIKECEETWKNM